MFKDIVTLWYLKCLTIFFVVCSTFLTEAQGDETCGEYNSVVVVVFYTTNDKILIRKTDNNCKVSECKRYQKHEIELGYYKKKQTKTKP